MAWSYRHLYKKVDHIDEDVINSICSCLLSKTALHFAGSWNESKLYFDERITKNILSDEMKDYFHIRKSPKS